MFVPVYVAGGEQLSNAGGDQHRGYTDRKAVNQPTKNRGYSIYDERRALLYIRRMMESESGSEYDRAFD